jgi:hypothetical protein
MRTLSSLSVSDLHAELRRRGGGLKRLERRRATLVKRLAGIESEIAALGGSLRGRPREGRRPRNEMTLNESLSKLLKGKTMSVTDAAEAVQKAGYRTNSNNFRTQVNIALIKGPFKRAGRGMYASR